MIAAMYGEAHQVDAIIHTDHRGRVVYYDTDALTGLIPIAGGGA